MRRMTGPAMLPAMVLAAVLGMLLPETAAAQRDCCNRNPFGFAPYVGVFRDAYDARSDGSALGWLVGFRAEYQEGRRTLLHANLGYAHTSDVARRSGLTSSVVLDHEWVMLTGGVSFALVPGNTSISVGADAGVAWRRVDWPDEDALIDPGDARWHAHEVVVPTLTLRHHFTRSVSAFGSAHDYITDILDGSVQHSPAFTMGLSFR